MEKLKGPIENGLFLFINKNREISCIKTKELSKEQLKEFVSRYIDHYRKLILESESKPLLNTGFNRRNTWKFYN